MSAGDVTLAQCFGFPAFIRVTGEYWPAGNYGGIGGTGVVGLRGGVNLAVSLWRRDGFYLPAEDGFPKEIGTLVPAITYAADEGLDLLNSYRLAASEWRALRYGVRQAGWTKGIYTHFVGDVIRRRTGPTAADCTYWRCKRRTDQVITVAGEARVGNDGRDPALAEMASWWELTTVPTPESRCVNTWITSRAFTEMPQTFVARDYKYVPGSALYYCFTEAMDQADLSLATSANQPWPAALAQSVFNLDSALHLPFPEWVRGLILATYDGTTNTWTHTGQAADLGYNTYATASYHLAQIPKGYFVVDSAGQIYRALEDVNYPPAAGPNTLPQFAAFDRARYSFQDHLLPTPYSNRVDIAAGRVTRRYFTRPARFARITIQSRLQSFWPGEPSINAATATVTEEVRSGCNQAAWPTRYLEKITSLDQHPLAAPDRERIVRTGKVGHYREYQFYPPSGSGPILQRLEWIGDPTEFIYPGQHIEVEVWIHDPTDRPDGLRAHARGGFVHENTGRYYAGLPSFWPLPGRQNFTAIASERTYVHPVYNLAPDPGPGWVYLDRESVFGVSRGFGSFNFDLVDDRQMSEAYEFVYPNRPGFTVQGGPYPAVDRDLTSGRLDKGGNVLYLASSETEQTIHYSQGLRWAIIRAHPDADVTKQILLPLPSGWQESHPIFQGTPEAAGYSPTGRDLNPMLVCRQRLNLYEQVSCS